MITDHLNVQGDSDGRVIRAVSSITLQRKREATFFLIRRLDIIRQVKFPVGSVLIKKTRNFIWVICNWIADSAIRFIHVNETCNCVLWTVGIQSFKFIAEIERNLPFG